MNSQISTKFAALAIALAINGAMIGSVAYLFSGRAPVTAMAQLLETAPTAAATHV